MVATMVTHTHLKTYRLALIADAHARAVERRISKGEIDMAEITDLSETQMGILDKGMRYETFALTRAEAGKAAGNLKTRGLIKKTSIQGRWTMTDQGKNEHSRIMAALTAAADITIEGLAPSTINMDDPALGAKDHVLQRWMTLADERQVTIKNLNKSLDDMGKLADDLAKKVKALEADQTMNTGINWYQRVIAPLIAFIVNDTQNPGSFDALRTDPEKILRFVTETRLNLHQMDCIADERAQIIEQRDSAIESLRREIDALKEKLMGIHPTRADVYLAGQILDELCEMIPEVEDFRLARENAVKAISTLKARR